MKKTAILLLLMLFAFGTEIAYSSGFKVAVVDLQKALNQTNEGKQAKQVLKSGVKQKQKIVQAKENELKKEKDALDKLSPSSPEYDKKLENYKNNVKNLQILIGKIQNELSKKESTYSKNILDSLVEIIKKLRIKNGYDLVLEIHSGVVDYNPSIDITKDLIRQYNKITTSKK